jgi:hypothetical protein
MNNTTFHFLIALSCCAFLPPTQSQIIINEVYADVAIGRAGDANGDGIRNAREDEFIELFNNANVPIDISHYTIFVSDKIKHQFKEGTFINAKSFIVVFGGGTPNGDFGGSPVALASKGRLSLENTGASVLIKDDSNQLLDSLSYSGDNINASWERYPTINSPLLPHNQIIGAFGQTFSPGTFSNSFPYHNGDTTLIHFAKTKGVTLESNPSFELFLNLINPKPTEEVAVLISLIGGTGDAADLNNFTTQTILFPVNSISQRKVSIPITNDTLFEKNETFIFSLSTKSTSDKTKISIHKNFELTILDNDFDLGLQLTELLADPPLGQAGDANLDGIRNSKSDEFLEFYNHQDTAINLSHLGIYDSETLRHLFPDSTIIAPKQILLIFGGGMITKTFGNAIIQTASTKDLSLANTGDQIFIQDSLGNVLFFYEYASKAGNNQSLIYCPDLGDLNGPNTLHSVVDDGQLFSPGVIANCEIRTNTVEQALADQVNIYPNPPQNIVHINLPSHWTIKQTTLLDNFGREIALLGNKKQVYLPITQLAKGIYFLKIDSSQGIIIKKIFLTNAQ